MVERKVKSEVIVLECKGATFGRRSKVSASIAMGPSNKVLPTIPSGSTTPVGTTSRNYRRHDSGLNTQVGHLYTENTAGALGGGNPPYSKVA